MPTLLDHAALLDRAQCCRFELFRNCLLFSSPSTLLLQLSDHDVQSVQLLSPSKLAEMADAIEVSLYAADAVLPAAFASWTSFANLSARFRQTSAEYKLSTDMLTLFLAGH